MLYPVISMPFSRCRCQIRLKFFLIKIKNYSEKHVITSDFIIIAGLNSTLTHHRTHLSENRR